MTAAGAPHTKADYLKGLIARAAALGSAAGPSQGDLQLFRERIMERPDDLRRRLLGANVQRRRALQAEQRRALDTLDATPDLLSPLGDLRYELSHSRLVAHFLNARTEPTLGPKLLSAFVALVLAPPLPVDVDLRNATVDSELWLPTGRVDISVSLPHHLIFIEMKVDAEEGADQLSRYDKALAARKAGREGLLVYLTRPEAKKSESGVAHVHLTLDTLLLRWLPLAGPGAGPEQYLARYLKSLALIAGCASVGAFDDWSITQQAAALDLVESMP